MALAATPVRPIGATSGGETDGGSRASGRWRAGAGAGRWCSARRRCRRWMSGSGARAMRSMKRGVRRGPRRRVGRRFVELVVVEVVDLGVGVAGGGWDWPVAYHQRLWGPQPRRPLSWVVNPPSGPGEDVVALALVGGDEAGAVTAAPVQDLEDAAQGPPERSCRADVRTRLGPSATTRWISVSSWPSSSATAPGAITVPAASSHTRPAKVSKSTITVTSGAGACRRRERSGPGWPSPPGRRDAAARRCGPGGLRWYRRRGSALAAAQSAANSSRSIRSSAPFTAAVATGVR